MAKARTYYFVPYGSGGQHGDRVETVEMTKKEFLNVSGKPRYERGGVYFEKYAAALYYAQD